MEPPRKRIRLAGADDTQNTSTAQAQNLTSLSRQVTPPARIGRTSHPPLPNILQSVAQAENERPRRTGQNVEHMSALAYPNDIPRLTASEPSPAAFRNRTVPSPVQLTRIRDLQGSENVDTISLHDVLGDPLLKEVWIFNFCFDVDWTMQHFDPDVRKLVQVKIIHGSWRREDLNKIGIDDACVRWPNVESIQAYLPHAFGTHHSKMFIIFRHDEQAQVIVHTANMLSKDWTNMTQAIWRSPLLPQKPAVEHKPADPTGSGSRFKHDLQRYLKAYGGKLKGLVKQLSSYDFSEVRAALVASVPSDFAVSAPDDDVWGHETLRRTLKTISGGGNPHFIYQVSSIASLPATWLKDTLYNATGGSSNSTSIIFPTADDVRLSLDGYAAGGSIHTKAQSSTHLKQITAIQPQLCRWSLGSIVASRAGRHTAAPHIKTFIRFAAKPSIDNPAPNIDWALVTSSNLSTQAWGTAAKLPKGIKDQSEARIKIHSFEIGVLVWPALYATTKEEMGRIKMVPTFKTDLPAADRIRESSVQIGFRMPYDLPLTPYNPNELPWSPQSSHDALDTHGVTWSVRQT